MGIILALLIAVLVGLAVKVILEAFSPTARYADAVALLAAILVFLSRTGWIG